MDISELKQVPKWLVNDEQIKVEISDANISNMRVLPSFYWKKFAIWKKHFKNLNPLLSELSANQRKEIYELMFRNFCERKN